MFSEEKYKQLLSLYTAFDEKALAIAREKCEIEGKTMLSFDEYHIEFDEETVEIHLTQHSHCSCCHDETDWIDFPAVYLFDPSWKEPLLTKQREQEAATLRKKKEQEAKQQALREQREQDEYMRLKAKFKEK